METKRPTESFVVTGRDLEDSFFLDQDRQLLESRAKLAKLAESKEALALVSGIRNQDILQHLVDLNVRPETLAALSAVPLVEVVWADGTVDNDERRVVLEFAAAQGIGKDSVAYSLLERWLEKRPSATLLEAWRHYVETLCGRLPAEERAMLKNELLRYVRAAAEASGGFLGVGAISLAEKAVIAKLEASFGGS